MKTNDRQSVCYGFDPGATRDAGAQCFAEVSKTVNNGTCPGHHTGVVEPVTLATGQANSPIDHGISPALPASMGMGGDVPMITSTIEPTAKERTR